MQDAADVIVEDLMMRYNQERPLVFNTLQMYRHDRLDYLKALNERALEKGFFIGMKVVRGAYMEKERERAVQKGYESPICIDKRATDENFDALYSVLLKHVLVLDVILHLKPFVFVALGENINFEVDSVGHVELV